MSDVIVILVLSLLGLAAHGARTQAWLQWTLRTIYAFCALAEFFTVFNPSSSETSLWTQGVTLIMAITTAGLLFRPFRQLVSWKLSIIDFVLSGQLFIALYKKRNLKEAFLTDRVFVPASIPHMNGLWIYITALGVLLANVNPDDLKMGSIGIPFPVPLDSLISYNLLGLVVLAFCGVGIFITRKPKEALQRLGIVKPKGWHIGVAILAVIGTMAYDFAWSFFTNTPQSGVGGHLAQYNAGTFTAGGAGGLSQGMGPGGAGAQAGPALILAILTAVCAGIGEETLMRGALQPALGILPAGILHGVLHGQFNHLPILMLQIAGWSAMLGIVRRYTNTTTTIIAHGTYNFIMSFLFAFNP